MKNKELWGDMIISTMMLDGLGREIGAMTLYAGMFMFIYDMMIDKLDYEIGAMMLNMKMYMFIWMIVLVNIRLI